MQEPRPPALHRRLPIPATSHGPVSRRSSALSQHHIFPDRQAAYEHGENAVRRSTVHFPQSTTSRHSVGQDVTLRSMSTAGHELISRPDGDHSMQLDGERAQHDTAHNVCLCQPDPKIPRPRNCEIIPSIAESFGALPLLISLISTNRLS